MQIRSPGWYISCAIPFYMQGQASAVVTRCGVEVTDEYVENAFQWTRDSGDTEADAVWNVAHAKRSIRRFVHARSLHLAWQHCDGRGSVPQQRMKAM